MIILAPQTRSHSSPSAGSNSSSEWSALSCPWYYCLSLSCPPFVTFPRDQSAFSPICTSMKSSAWRFGFGASTRLCPCAPRCAQRSGFCSALSFLSQWRPRDQPFMLVYSGINAVQFSLCWAAAARHQWRAFRKSLSQTKVDLFQAIEERSYWRIFFARTACFGRKNWTVSPMMLSLKRWF